MNRQLRIFDFKALAVERTARTFRVTETTEDAARTAARNWVIDHLDLSCNWLIELISTEEHTA